MATRWVSPRSLPFVSLIALILMVACGAPESRVLPGHFTQSEFRSLQWLEGEWRGTGGERPFYEGYELLNDSTMQIHYYTDSTRTAERGSGSVYLSEGVIYHETDGAVWVAVQLDTTGIQFAPYEGAQNSFRWTRLSPTRWEADLHFDGGPETRYELSRIAN